VVAPELLTSAAEAIAVGLRSPGSDDSAVQAALAELHIPAISVAVVREGELAAARAWGTRDVAATGAATEATRFMAGSVSKPVAATGALRLVADGVLDLDQDVNRYLKRWQVPLLGEWQPTLTLRHLLSHTAGTTVHGFPGYPRTEPPPDVIGVLTGAGNTPAVVVDSLPGMRWRYSGGGTTIVQALLEDVTGTPFAQLMREMVLDPAGMTTADFSQPPGEDLHPLLAEGMAGDGTPVPGGWHIYPEMAAAGLWCTPSDLARWIIAVQQSVNGTGSLVPGDIARTMLAEQAPGWGLGPHVSRPGEHPRFGHGGADEGFLTTLEAGQHDGTGIVVMASSNAANPLMAAVVTAVATAEEWPPMPTATTDVAALLATYAGAWRTADGLDVRIEPAPQGLTLHLPGQQPLPLSPHSLSLWSTPVGAEVEFAPVGVGEPRSALTIRPASAFTARRVDSSADESE